MTTIAVAKKNGQVAIAADTLTKWGDTKETSAYILNHQKILRVGDSYLAITGPTSGKLVLSHYFSHAEEQPRFGSVEEIFETWLLLHDALKSNYYLNPDEDRDDSFESTQMDVLLANQHGIFGIARHRSVQEFSRFYAFGRGNEYATGAMYAVYDDPKKSAQDIVELGVRAAAEFDDSTGLPIVSFAAALAIPLAASVS